jgi:hypothetical protein
MVLGERWFVGILVVLACLGVAVSACAARPVVFLTEKQIEAARERIQRDAWAERSYAPIKANARSWLARRPDFPEGPTGWYHDYFCPEHGVFLTYDPGRPDEHYCRAGNHYVRGEKLDAYWRATTLSRFVNGARDLGTVYAIEGDRECAATAREILVSFADYYEKSVKEKKPPRLMWQTLDEAWYILSAVAAYELIYESGVVSDDDRRCIEEKWFRPTAEFIKSQTRVIHNIHCWQNSAVLCLGLALRDKGLVDFAINDPRSGFRRQIAEGVLDDGIWYECSFGYHFYTISALENTIIPAVSNRMDISVELRKIRKMFEVPIFSADRHFELPSPNDGSGGRLWDKTGAYEFGYFLFPEEKKFGQLLQFAYSDSARGRAGRSVLFYGVEKLPDGGLMPERESVNVPGFGLAILRLQRGDDYLYAAVDYGPHGGGHGHPDKLNVIFSGLGQMFSPDLGSAGYGLKVHGAWYRQSLSHNVVVVDRQSQKPSTGKLVEFRGKGDVKWVSARADEAYPGVRWQRTVFLCGEGYFVVADSLQGENEHTFDWAYHNLGTLGIAGANLTDMRQDDFGDGAGYEVPRELRVAKSAGEVLASWRLDKTRRVELHIPACAPETNRVITAVAPGNPSMVEMPMIMWRRRGKDADFWAVIEPVKGESQISRATVSEGRLTVELKDGAKRAFFVEKGVPGSSVSRSAEGGEAGR